MADVALVRIAFVDGPACDRAAAEAALAALDAHLLVYDVGGDGAWDMAHRASATPFDGVLTVVRARTASEVQRVPTLLATHPHGAAYCVLDIGAAPCTTTDATCSRVGAASAGFVPAFDGGRDGTRLFVRGHAASRRLPGSTPRGWVPAAGVPGGGAVVVEVCPRGARPFPLSRDELAAAEAACRVLCLGAVAGALQHDADVGLTFAVHLGRLDATVAAAGMPSSVHVAARDGWTLHVPVRVIRGAQGAAAGGHRALT